MYSPVQHGIKKESRAVYYEEIKPPSELSELVHCFWQLKTENALPESFHYHVLPDACIDLIFDFSEPTQVTVMTPGTSSTVLDLGSNFYYLGIRLLPGVWTTDIAEIIGDYKQYTKVGSREVNGLVEELKSKDFKEQQKILSLLVKQLYNSKLINSDKVVVKVLKEIDSINSVESMALKSGLSTRQLQRHIKQSTGFTPHDFLKILRLQQSFEQGYTSLYADQSHFIHTFHKITNYTPSKYKTTFDV